jgi:hypothetical protein
VRRPGDPTAGRAGLGVGAAQGVRVGAVRHESLVERQGERDGVGGRGPRRCLGVVLAVSTRLGLTVGGWRAGGVASRPVGGWRLRRVPGGGRVTASASAGRAHSARWRRAAVAAGTFAGWDVRPRARSWTASGSGGSSPFTSSGSGSEVLRGRWLVNLVPARGLARGRLAMSRANRLSGLADLGAETARCTASSRRARLVADGGGLENR